jgi:predicted Zn-dependent protease
MKSTTSLRGYGCALLALVASVSAPHGALGAEKIHPTYQNAKKKLPEDWYVVYRVVDRIARANELDKTPWRVDVVKEYQINAYASDVNLVAVYAGILDQVTDSSSAVACIVGHEMAHHVKRHTAVGEAEKAELVAKLRAEATTAVEQEKASARSEREKNAVGSSLARAAGGSVPFVGSLVGDGAGKAIEKHSEENDKSSEARIEQIVSEKKAKLEAELAAKGRDQEFEADALGYRYAATAGFDPQGCIRVMEVLSQTPGGELDTEHPAAPKRIEKLKELMAQEPAEPLKARGEQTLAKNAEPLTFDLARDQKTLRINPARGGSAADDLESRFDK